jgi:hypothetical protein
MTVTTLLVSIGSSPAPQAAATTNRWGPARAGPAPHAYAVATADEHARSWPPAYHERLPGWTHRWRLGLERLAPSRDGFFTGSCGRAH